jgi:putative membrane protein
MRDFLINLVANMLSIAVTVWLLPGIYIPQAADGFVTLVVIALVFGLVNAVIRPILLLLSLPFIVVTLGLFFLVINGLMLALTAAITPLEVTNFGWAVLGALFISFINMILYSFVREDQQTTTFTINQ